MISIRQPSFYVYKFICLPAFYKSEVQPHKYQKNALKEKFDFKNVSQSLF
jgi:hypothetical protein